MDETRPNARGTFTLSFTAADLLIMADALAIGSTTASMSGSTKSGSRLRELQNQFMDLSPLPKSGHTRADGYKWFNACKAVAAADFFEVMAVKSSLPYEKDKRHLVVEVDGKEYIFSEGVPEEDAVRCLPEISDFMAEIAGLDTRRLVPVESKLALQDDGGDWWKDGKVEEASKSALAEILGDDGIPFFVRTAKRSWGDRDGRISVGIVVSVPEGSAERVVELLDAAFEADKTPSPTV